MLCSRNSGYILYAAGTEKSERNKITRRSINNNNFFHCILIVYYRWLYCKARYQWWQWPRPNLYFLFIIRAAMDNIDPPILQQDDVLKKKKVPRKMHSFPICTYCIIIIQKCPRKMKLRGTRITLPCTSLIENHINFFITYSSSIIIIASINGQLNISSLFNPCVNQF